MTMATVLGLNVITVWQQRKAEWVDVARLAVHVHVGRQQKGGVDVIDVAGEEDAPPLPLGPEAECPPRPQGDSDAPPRPLGSPVYGHPCEAGGVGGAGGTAGAEGGGGGVDGAAASAAAGGGLGGACNERGGRQPRPGGPPVQGQ